MSLNSILGSSLGMSASMPSLVSTASMPLGLLGGPAPGTNKLNPLQGQPAVQGIGQFINQILITSTIRKATKALTGGLTGGAGGLDPNALIGQLGSLLGGAGGGLLG